MKAKYCQKKGCIYLAFHSQVAVCQAVETRTKDHLKVLGRALWKLEECPNKIYEPKQTRVPTKRISVKTCGSCDLLTVVFHPAYDCMKSTCSETGKIIGDMARCPVGVAISA